MGESKRKQHRKLINIVKEEVQMDVWRWDGIRWDPEQLSQHKPGVLKRLASEPSTNKPCKREAVEMGADDGVFTILFR